MSIFNVFSSSSKIFTSSFWLGKTKDRLFDLTFCLLYLFSNPFRICRRWMERRGEENIYAYGETPLTLWEQIANSANLKKEDVFCDLGCGRGRLVFWTAKRYGCKAIGVDWVPTFITRASLLVFLFRLRRVLFFKRRMTEALFHEVTVVYLYTFHRDEEIIDFSQLRRGARVISVSEPLSGPHLVVTASIKVSYPWGETDIFIQERK